MPSTKQHPPEIPGRHNSYVPDHQLNSADPRDVTVQIAALSCKGVDALRVMWSHHFRSTAPPIQSTDVLRRIFAFRLQAESYGDLDNETEAKIKRSYIVLAKSKNVHATSLGVAIPTAGSVLVREWRGVMHRVLVLDDAFEHEGKRYRSLSEVACAISGTHWSGPRFFGLQRSKTHAQHSKLRAQRL